MKKLILLFVSVPLFAAPLGVMRTNIVLQTDYPVNISQTNTFFKIYSTTNVTLAITNWPVIQVVKATNNTVNLPIDFSQRFYYMTVSNWWGETNPSNVAATPPTPQSDSTLSIGQ